MKLSLLVSFDLFWKFLFSTFDLSLEDELEGVGEDIQTDESKVKMRYRAKYLMFNENRRPAYYGTWRKKSKTITARRPFLQDQVSLNTEASVSTA
jgi:chromatin assembly factor 1 subunit A